MGKRKTADTLSDVGFTPFNYTLRFGQVGLDIEVPFRISAFHYITGYIIWINKR